MRAEWAILNFPFQSQCQSNPSIGPVFAEQRRQTLNDEQRTRRSHDPARPLVPPACLPACLHPSSLDHRRYDGSHAWPVQAGSPRAGFAVEVEAEARLDIAITTTIIVIITTRKYPHAIVAAQIAATQAITSSSIDHRAAIPTTTTSKTCRHYIDEKGQG